MAAKQSPAVYPPGSRFIPAQFPLVDPTTHLVTDPWLAFFRNNNVTQTQLVGNVTTAVTVPPTVPSGLTLDALIIGQGTTQVAPLGSLGTTTTVLHGNAAGPPTFSAVNLATDVTGILPVGNLPPTVVTGTGPFAALAIVTGTGTGITTGASGTLTATGTVPAGAQIVGVANTSSTGNAQIGSFNDINSRVVLAQSGSAFAPTGIYLADGSVLSSTGAGGLTLDVVGAASLMFAVNSAVVGTMYPSGGFAWGSAVDPGAANVSVAGKMTVNGNTVLYPSGGISVGGGFDPGFGNMVLGLSGATISAPTQLTLTSGSLTGTVVLEVGISDFTVTNANPTIVGLFSTSGFALYQSGGFVIGPAVGWIDPGAGNLKVQNNINAATFGTTGSWTPVDASGAGLVFTGVIATYAKVGKLCFFSCQLSYPATASALAAVIGGLPFVEGSGNSTAITVGYQTSTTFFFALRGIVGGSSSNVYPNYNAASGLVTNPTNAQLASSTMIFSGLYRTT